MLVPTLQIMPKWQLLSSIMEEIQTQRSLLVSRANAASEGATQPAVPAMITCRQSM
jgi:hypothetical protein